MLHFTLLKKIRVETWKTFGGLISSMIIPVAEKTDNIQNNYCICPVVVVSWRNIRSDVLLCSGTMPGLCQVLIKSLNVERREEERREGRRKKEREERGEGRRKRTNQSASPPSIMTGPEVFCPSSWVVGAAEEGQFLGQDNSSSHLLSTDCVSDARLISWAGHAQGTLAR